VLRHGIIACPEEFHLDSERVHRNQCQQHCGLKETFEPRGLHKPVSEAEKSLEMGLARGQYKFPIDSKLIGAPRHCFSNAAKLQSAFTGTTSQRGPQAQICLHRHRDPGCRFKPSRYDVDSGISLFQDLSVIKHTLVYVPTPQRTSCLTKSLHIKVPVDVGGQRQPVPVQKVPHILFGRVGRYPLYIFFPRMYKGQEEPAMLTDEQYGVLFDEVTHPALAQLGADIQHHIPVSFEAAMSSSKARAEASARSSTRGVGLQIQISADNIPSFWQAMQSQIEQQGILEPFRDLFFLYDCMSHKLEYREATSLNHCLERFWDDYTTRVTRSQGLFERDTPSEGVFDKQEYVDVAAEFLPFDNSDGSCNVVLAQRCCQYNTLKLLFGDYASALLYEPPPEDDSASGMYKPRKATTTEYNLYGLRDAVDVTCEPNLTSSAFKNGLAYFQSYSVSEELFLSTGVKPFSNDDFNYLPYGHAEWKSVAANAKLEVSRQHIFAALDAAVHRVYAAVNPTRPAAIGHRMEFRIKPRLADLLQISEASYCAKVYLVNGEQPKANPALRHRGRRVEDIVSTTFDLGDRAQLGRILTQPESRGFCCIPYPEFRSFLHGNIQKHVLALDSILAYYDCVSESESRRTPQAAASLFGLVLLSLQHFISCLRPSVRWVLDNPLRRDIAAQAGTTKPGMGFRKTIDQRGFMFWQDIIDWQTFELRNDVLDQVTIPGRHSRASFRAIKTMRVDRTFIDGWCRLCNNANLTREQSRLLMEAGVNFLLRTYRQQAVLKLFPNAVKVRETLEYYELDTLRFTLQDLRKANQEFASVGTNVASGNRAALLEPLAYFDWLWTDKQSSVKRTFTDNLPFREHYRKASSAMSSSPSPLLTIERFERLLYHRFFQQHSCVPYPSNGTFMSTVKGTGNRSLCCWKYTGTPHGFSLEVPVQPRIVVSIRDKCAVTSPDPTYPPKYIARLLIAKDVEEGLRFPEVLRLVGDVGNGDIAGGKRKRL